ncbi:MAG: MBL fold metallo-hydrolase [Bacilli bacterium]|jgi:glyoxylase-like metal-dependent hydrolase (beta-lactamase superfamily II)
MQIFTLNYSDDVCNTYIIDDEKGKAALVDPGYGDSNAISEFLKKRSLSLESILITHGHFDHIRGLTLVLKDFPDAKVYIHENEVDFLSNPRLNCSYMDRDIKPVVLDVHPIKINDGDQISILGLETVVIHTPFHTHGSTCYYFPSLSIIFTGDTLFMNAIGRSDLPTGSPRSIISSLAKFKVLPPNTKVYPGHGKSTNIERELKYNTFLAKEYIPNGK